MVEHSPSPRYPPAYTERRRGAQPGSSDGTDDWGTDAEFPLPSREFESDLTPDREAAGSRTSPVTVCLGYSLETLDKEVLGSG